MRRCSVILLSLGVTLTGLGTGVRAQSSPAEPDSVPRPNILLIVADDLGYSDLGAYGGEIATPNLDDLARAGATLTGFHTASSGAPTRAMLLSGIDHHQAGLGCTVDRMAPNQQGKPGYEGSLNFQAVCVASLLHTGGYHTYMAGKWDLGLELSQGPKARGFERSFALLQGEASHLDQTGVTKDDKKARYLEDSTFVDLPTDFFSTEFYTDKLIGYIDEHHGDGQPFFAYAAYTAPHWPLQVPDDYIDRYAGTYDGGHDSLLVARVKRMVAVGVIRDSIPLPAGFPGHTRWNKLKPDERKVAARKMEIYAAMVENLDFHVGRLLDHLREIGEYENTLIVFMSDSGADGSDPASDPDTKKWIEKTFDNSLANLGRKGSMAARGPDWAQASTAPFRAYKEFTSQGGTHSPFIVFYPPLITEPVQHGEFVSVLDVVPTFLELAGVAYPDVHGGRKTIVLQGSSAVPFLRGEQKRLHPADHTMGWELFGRRALLASHWKILWQEKPYGEGDWELYDLRTDPAEANDLSKVNPERIRTLAGMWEQYAKENGVILPQFPQEDIETWDSY